MLIYLIIFILIIVLIYVFITYNSLIKSNNLVKEAFSTMDIYLKKRWDLIPNLVEIVKGYAKYEKNVFSEVTTLRTNQYKDMSVNQKINVNEKLTEYLSQIIAISESYPELKASENFLQLSRDLTKIEDEIANSRKYYNGCVRIFNNKIQTFPNNIIASIFKYKEAKMFEANIEEKQNIRIDL